MVSTNIQRWWSLHLWHHPERWARCIFLLYVALMPGSIITLLFGEIPANARGFGGVLLVLQGTSIALWLLAWLGRSAWWPIAIIAFGAWAVEHVGATYDVPFGSYDYTAVLGPMIFATVPVVIVFAWLMVIAGAWQSVITLTPQASWWMRCVGTGLVVMLFDILIEPVATHINGYWIWYDTGPYYGVPTVNFAGWWLVGFGLACATDRWLRHIPAQASRLPIVAMLTSSLLFAVMTFKDGYYLATALSVATLVGAWWWYRSRAQ